MTPPVPFQIQTVLAALLVALLFRVVDIFIFRLDERWGEILLSKSLTLVLVLALVATSSSDLRAIGLRGAGAGVPVAIAVLGITVLFGIALTIQLSVFRIQGSEFSVSIQAIDPKTSLTGGLDFALLLLAGNVINAVAEESLFRGLMLPAFESQLGLWAALALQAVLFGAWHLVWPMKAVFAGEATVASAFGAGLALFAASSIAGLAFGLMYSVTRSLWVPIAVHFLNNGFYNFVHIHTNAGADKNVVVMQAVATIGLLALVPLLRVAVR